MTRTSAPRGRPRCLRRPDGTSATSSSLTAQKAQTTRTSRQNDSRRRGRTSSGGQPTSWGFFDVRLLNFTDGELVHSRALVGAITREIREFRPYAVYTHDPEPVIINNSFINHSDHRATGLGTVDAVYPAARDRLNFPEQIASGLDVHKVKELYLWGANEPNFSVDISAVIEQKVAALMAHDSQFGGESDFVLQIRAHWQDDDGRYVERFRRIILFR